jgi:uncharacterized membrane protein YecN with MAPEG domain
MLLSEPQEKSGDSEMVLPITLTMAAGAALVHIWLALRCSMIRIRQKVLVGDGGNATLVARMRAHSNFTENASIFLILLALNELAEGSQRWLWIVGIAFIVARIAHALGMDRNKPNALRAGGMMVTIFTLIVLAISAIRLAYQAGQPVMLG